MMAKVVIYLKAKEDLLESLSINGLMSFIRILILTIELELKLDLKMSMLITLLKYEQKNIFFKNN
jgi:hypothetical protein